MAGSLEIPEAGAFLGQHPGSVSPRGWQWQQLGPYPWNFFPPSAPPLSPTPPSPLLSLGSCDYTEPTGSSGIISLSSIQLIITLNLSAETLLAVPRLVLIRKPGVGILAWGFRILPSILWVNGLGLGILLPGSLGQDQHPLR